MNGAGAAPAAPAPPPNMSRPPLAEDFMTRQASLRVNRGGGGCSSGAPSPPPNVAAPPPGAPVGAPQPPAREHNRGHGSVGRSEQKVRQRLEKRDFIVDCIINDGVPSRSTTPRNPAKHGSRTPRSSSRGPPQLPTGDVSGARSRSMPHYEARDGSQPATPRRPPPPGPPQGGSCPPKDTKSLNINLFEANPSPRGPTGAPCPPLLPQLGARQKTRPPPPGPPMSQSARGWRGRAAMGLYT